MTILSIIVFVLIFSFLVLIHELGHFWAARRAGVAVEEFGLGIPPRIWGILRKGTIYSLNAIPFGGFVKMKGEDTGANDTDSLAHASFGWKFLIITAGVIMNLLSAYVLICVGMWLGMPPLASDPTKMVDEASQINSQILVVEVADGLPAQKSDLKSGDVLVSIDGQKIESVGDLASNLSNKKQVEVGYIREGEQFVTTSGVVAQSGKPVIGVAVDEVVSRVNYKWWMVPVWAIQDFSQIVVKIGESIWAFVAQIFTTGSVSREIAGPVGIAKITAQAVDMGFIPVLQLMIFLSINLGLLNLFPFPALDGGRLVFLIVEIVGRGRRVSPVVENVIHNLGFILLLMLIAVVTYRDVLKLL